MKIVREQSLAFHTTRLVFSESEKRALLAASRIAEQAREKCRQVCGAEFEQDSIDTILAELEHNHIDIIDGIILAESFEPASWFVMSGPGSSRSPQSDE